MAEISTIARPYAEAAFSIAEASGDLSGWSVLLGNLAATAARPEVRNLLGNPLVSNADLIDIFASASGKPSADTRNFLSMLVDNGRLAALESIRDQFDLLKQEHEGTVDAMIESAFPLDTAALADLVAHLERKFSRKIRPTVTVDTDLIGGVRIAVGDQVIDSSVRGQLSTMATRLASA